MIQEIVNDLADVNVEIEKPVKRDLNITQFQCEGIAQSQITILNRSVRNQYDSQTQAFKDLVSEESQMLAFMKSIHDNQL